MSSVPSEPFRFRAFLTADMRRFKTLTSPTGQPSGPIWTALLSPRFAPVFLFRLSQALRRAHLGPLAKIVGLLNFTLFGIEIASQCHIGKGLFFPHTQGTVIGAAGIGDNAIIYHGVTLGARSLDMGFNADQRPTVGDNVLIASGASILGGLTVGSGAKVGANALVTRSVPEYAVVKAPLAVIDESVGFDD
jgi:serine O-acetyltransferase